MGFDFHRDACLSAIITQGLVEWVIHEYAGQRFHISTACIEERCADGRVVIDGRCRDDSMPSSLQHQWRVRPIANTANRPMVLMDECMMVTLVELDYFNRLFIPSPHASPIRK